MLPWESSWEIPWEAQEVLQQQCPLFVSTEDHVASWKRTKEYTSSGISGLHFGMFKAQCKDVDLAAFDVSRRSIMYSTGSYYPRWNTGVDVMLLKASLDTRAHKLRTILLLEADFNMNCKKLGREGMWFAEEHGCVAREQGGGRRNHRAEDSSLNLVLINDDARFKRKAMAIICTNDAKGCYDRIVHSIAFICLQRFGVPRPPLLSMFQVIQNLTHHIRTVFGDSECTYGPHTGEHPNQGILQGNGAAGATWAAVSTPIFNAMRSTGFGYSSWSAISKGVVDLVCSAFIDDNDLVHSGPTNDTPASVVLEGMQSALDTWDGLLRVTGGTFPRLREVMMPLIFQYLNYVGFYTKPTTLFLLIYLILPSIYPIDTLYQLHHHHAQTVYPQPRRATGSCGFSVLNYLGCSTRLPTTDLFTIFTNNNTPTTVPSRALLQCLFPPSPHCFPMHPRSETTTTLPTSPLSRRFSAVILNRINRSRDVIFGVILHSRCAILSA